MLNIKSRYISVANTFFQFTNSQYTDFEFPRHFHEHYSLQIIHEGTNIGFTERKKYQVEKHGLLIINPGEIHGGTTPPQNALQYSTFRIDPAMIHAIMGQNQIPTTATVFFDTSPIYSRILRDLILDTIETIYAEQYDCTEERLTALIMHLLIEHSNQEKNMDQPVKHPAIQRAQEYIHANYDQSFTLQDLAREAHISPYHLIRTFKKVRVSPHSNTSEISVWKKQKNSCGNIPFQKQPTASDFAITVIF